MTDPPPLAQLSEADRAAAMRRYAVLRPQVEDGVPLAQAAAAAGVPLRTAVRWLTRYRADGLAGLARARRLDRGSRRLPPELVALVEGLALRRPRPSAAQVHRQVSEVAAARGWPAPSYPWVHRLVHGLDPDWSRSPTTARRCTGRPSICCTGTRRPRRTRRGRPTTACSTCGSAARAAGRPSRG